MLAAMCTSPLASGEAILDDKPWDPEALHDALNANLIMNGDFLLGSEPLRGISRRFANDKGEQPCWDRLDGQTNFTMIKHKGLEPVGDIYAWYQVSTVRYFPTGKEDPYDVNLIGRFPDADKLALYAMICEETCRYKNIELSKYSKGFKGSLDAPKSGEYIQRFVLGMGGSDWSIEGLHVFQRGLYKRKFVEGRDRLSLGLCEDIKNHMQGEQKWIDHIKIILANLIFIGIIIFFAFRRDYSYAIITTCLYVTSGLGLFGLYVGASDVRLSQGVTDRRIISLLVNTTITFITFLSLGYYCIHRIKNKVNVKLEGLVVPPSIPVVGYSVLLAVVMSNTLMDAISYYVSSNAIGKEGALYISYLREGISQDTMGLKSHYFRLIFIVFPIILSLYLVKTLSAQRRWFWPLLITTCTSLLLILNGEKAPLVWYIVTILFVFLADHGRLRVMAFVMAIILGSLFMLYVPIDKINLMADRAIYGGLTVAYKALELFPNEIDYLHGKSISLFGYSLASPYFNLDLLLWRNIFPESYYSGVSGTSTGPVWVQGYVNYGWLGIPMVSFICGGIMAAYCIIAKSIAPKAVSYAILGWLIFHYSGASESNASRYIADFYAVSVFIAVGIYLFLSAFKRRIARKV